MATQTAISPPGVPVLRRSTTLPTALQRPLPTTTTTTTNDIAADQNDAAETLFTHPAARIVCFSASSHSCKSRINTPSATQPGLPWSSKAERVVAVGQTPLPSSASGLCSPQD